MALTRLFVHDTFYDATDNFTYTPGMRLTLDNTTQSARITRLQNSGVVSTDETIDPSGVAITGGTINGTTIGATTPAAGTFTAITVDTTTLVVDATNNRVGIGTASPSQALDVSGIVLATRFYIDDGNAVIERSSGALNIQTFAGNNILLNPGGNVGVGTSDPDFTLDVVGQIQADHTGQQAFRARRSTSSAFQVVDYVGFTQNASSTYVASGAIGFGLGDNTASAEDGYMRITTMEGGTSRTTYSIVGAGRHAWSLNNSELMRLDTTGLGIGTTSPITRLHVRDDAATPMRVQRESNGQFIFLDGNGYSGYHTLDGTAYFIGHTSASRGLGLQVNNSTALYIDIGGGVGINETSPDYTLDVNGTFGFTPGTSVTPVDNGDVVFEATNNTTFTVKLKGTDGTVRSGTLTLA